MTEKDIMQALLNGYTGKWHPHKHLIVPHSCGVTGYESDLAIISKAGWITEVEIKVSASDFRSELRNKREKHASISRGYTEWGWQNQEKTLEFSRLDEHGKELYKIPTVVRRFWFAMPESVYQQICDIVPGWAGIITVGSEKNRGGYHLYREVCQPTLLPCRKAGQESIEMAYRSIYYRSWEKMALVGGVKDGEYLTLPKWYPFYPEESTEEGEGVA